MPYVSIEKIMETAKTGGIYKLTLAAAARANQLAAGAEPLIETEAQKVTTIALQEIVEGKVSYEAESNKPKGKKASS